MTLALLCAFALLAGFVDSIGGGGGLIQLPPLLILRDDLPHATLLGTNKVAAVTGTGAAAATYLRRVRLDWSLIGPAALAAALYSAIGARIASVISSQVFRPIVLALLIAVGLYTYFKPAFGSEVRQRPVDRLLRVRAALIGGYVGFYDGFFGPGTGSFLMFLFVGVLGLDFLHASASAKLVNTATNLAAIAAFASQGYVLYGVALPMAACNVVGGLIGARLALRIGSRFVRIVFLVVVTAFVLRLAYEIVAPLLAGG
ncbi:MAG TPA: TSUP family transporter [Herpetosiphonaceae bacterium]